VQESATRSLSSDESSRRYSGAKRVPAMVGLKGAPHLHGPLLGMPTIQPIRSLAGGLARRDRARITVRQGCGPPACRAPSSRQRNVAGLSDTRPACGSLRVSNNRSRPARRIPGHDGTSHPSYHHTGRETTLLPPPRKWFMHRILVDAELSPDTQVPNAAISSDVIFERRTAAARWHRTNIMRTGHSLATA
jgi:hypothetical protein